MSKNNDLFKKLFLFMTCILISIVLYLLFVTIWMHLSSSSIIFMVSCVLAPLISGLIFILLSWKFSNLYDVFTKVITSFCCCIFILGFSVFGPVFIDRSISYHIAFYAAEQGSVNISDIEECFSQAIFDKRIHDALASGFIEMQTKDTFSPTMKAKMMYSILKPIGELTNSMNTYKEMKKEVDANENK